MRTRSSRRIASACESESGGVERGDGGSRSLVASCGGCCVGSIVPVESWIPDTERESTQVSHNIPCPRFFVGEDELASARIKSANVETVDDV